MLEYRQVCLGWHSVRLGWHSMHTLWLPENGRNWLSIQPKMAHSFSASNMPMQADTMPTQADSTVCNSSNELEFNDQWYNFDKNLAHR